jgi:hypothetical protein
MTFLGSITGMVGSMVVAMPFIPAMITLILIMKEELQTSALLQPK